MSPRIRQVNSEGEEIVDSEEEDSEYDDDDLSEADMTPSDEDMDSEAESGDEDESEEEEDDEDEDESEEESEEEAETFVSKNKRTIVSDLKDAKKAKYEEKKPMKKIEITEPKVIVEKKKHAEANNIQSPPQSSAVTPVKEQKTSKQETPKTEASTPKTESPASAIKILPSGLKIEEVKMGNGIKAQKGRTVGVTYTVTDDAGQVIASNKNKESLVFNLSERQVLPALSIGIQGMALGGERKITVPGNMVEANSQPAIPHKGTCIIHVTLDNVQNKK